MATEAEKQYAYNTFVVMRDKYKALYDRVKADNVRDGAKATVGGHGWDHNLWVAQAGAIIAETQRRAEMVWIVGLAHSTDRLYGDYGELANAVLDEYFALLPEGEFTEEELHLMRDAIARHMTRDSDADLDNPVLMDIKDADKIANIGALNFIRGGQHRNTIPACIPEYVGTKHPESTFRNIMSCYDALWFNLEWEGMIRSPKAKELGRQDFDEIRAWQASVVRKFTEVGLFPFPTD